MPTTRRQSSRVLRTTSSTSRNTQRQRQSQQRRRHAQSVASAREAENPLTPPPPPPPATALSSSSPSTGSHPSLNAATDPSGSRAASSTFEPRAGGSGTTLHEQKYLSAYEKLYTFAPTTQEVVSEQASSHVARTRDLLERFRERLFQQVLDAVAREARVNDRLFQRLDTVAPTKVVRIEEIRFEALDELESFDNAVENDPSNAEEQAEACAIKLQEYVDELHNSIDWQDKTSDAFALGAMVMIIEEVITRGSRGGPQMRIYEVLISDPPEDGQELRALSYIQEYSEDMLTGYIDQLVYIIQQVERMVGRLKPRSLFARDLDALIQPIRLKRDAQKRQSEPPPPPPPPTTTTQRGQKRRESGLYEEEGGGAGQSGRASSKRPSRR